MIVLTANYLHDGLAAINEEALRSGRRWLLAKSSDSVLWIGPLFEPRRTACWECLAQRLRLNLPSAMATEGDGGGGALAVIDDDTPPSTVVTATSVLDSEVARAFSGSGLPAGEILTIDLATMKRERHTVVRRPQCSACGDGAAAAEPEPVHLASRPKRFSADGGYRVCTPEQTLSRYSHHVSLITGIVSGLSRVELPADAGPLHAYTAKFPIQEPARRNRRAEQGFLRPAAGKGATDTQARASGLCEAIERYSGYFQGTEPLCRARFIDIAPDAIHPNSCMLFSETQYARRAELNAAGVSIHAIPRRFDQEVLVDWAPVWSLSEQRFKYALAMFCYYGYPTTAATDFCRADSNGNAAGNCLEEAVLQGALELVERDAVAIWWYNRVQRPGVDLESFGEPYFTTVRQTLARFGRELWLLDITGDLGIPVFAALTRRIEGAEEAIQMGFGAHLDARLAALRAVTELNQVLAVAWEDDGGGDDEPEYRWAKSATLVNQPYLAPDPTAPPRTATGFPRAENDDLLADVTAVRTAIERQGMEMLVFDQTRTDVGLSVVKVIVPGLRHFFPRFASGRLYDVPVALGWLDRPLIEDELNPNPVLL